MSNSISVDFFKILTCSCHFNSNFDISCFMNSSCLEFCSSISIESEDNLSLETLQKLTFITSYTNLCKLLEVQQSSALQLAIIIIINRYEVSMFQCYNVTVYYRNLPSDHFLVCLSHWEDNPEMSSRWGAPSPDTTERLALWGCCQHSQTNPQSFVCSEPPDLFWNSSLHWGVQWEVDSYLQYQDQKNRWGARWRKQI